MSRRVAHLPSWAVLVVGVALTVALVATGSSRVDAGEETVEIHRMASADFETHPDEPVFLAIVGTDDRPGVSGARADAIHVVGIDPEQGRASMIDIPRDTWVNLPGRGMNKINNSHTFGGPELVGRTLTELTGADIRFVITTNFEGFTSLVEEMEGVRAEVPVAIRDSASGADFPAGRHLLSGDAALALARARKGVPRGDFSRSWHQGLLLLDALERVHQEGDAPETTMRLAAILLRHLKTTTEVGIGDLYELGRLATTIDPSEVTHRLMPGTTGSAGGASVVHPTGGAAPLFADFADDGVIDDPELGDTGSRLEPPERTQE